MLILPCAGHDEEAVISLDPPVGPYDHVLGPPDAELTLVEYGDFECPHCRDAAPVLEAVRDRFGGRLRFAFRHFPLHEVHPHAIAAALAAEMAGFDGRFWEMHDTLFAPGDDRVASLFLWHFCEEVEHRSSGLIIYQEVVRSRWYRTAVVPSAAWHSLAVMELILEGFNRFVPLEDRVLDARVLSTKYSLRTAVSMVGWAIR